MMFSPDGNYFVVETERGRLDVNGPEDSLWFYRSQDVRGVLKPFHRIQAIAGMGTVARTKEGPVLGGWRWLPDSSGMAFLERTYWQ